MEKVNVFDEYRISFSSSREEFIIDHDGLKDATVYLLNSQDVFNVCIRIFEHTVTEKEVGCLYLQLCMEKVNCKDEFKAHMDDYGVEVGEAAWYLSNTKEFPRYYKRAYGLALEGKAVHSGVLTGIYIYPEHRNKGIASLVLKNLGKMLESCYNIQLRCVVTKTNVHEFDDKASEEFDEEEMKKLMIAVLEKSGYDVCENTNWYVRDYCENFVGHI